MAPTSPTSEARRRRDGFTLIEMAVALLVVALVAALALPRLLPGRDSHVIAYDIAALLRADREYAARQQRLVMTRIDVAGRQVVSGASTATVSVPANLSLRLADGGDGIAFLPDGRASDAVVVLSEARQGYGVRVNGLSGAVDIVRTRP